MKKNLSYWFISGLLLAIVRGPVFYIFLYSKLALLGSWVIIPVFIAISALLLWFAINKSKPKSYLKGFFTGSIVGFVSAIIESIILAYLFTIDEPDNFTLFRPILIFSIFGFYLILSAVLSIFTKRHWINKIVDSETLD